MSKEYENDRRNDGSGKDQRAGDHERGNGGALSSSRGM
jgi:hypothetical protein